MRVLGWSEAKETWEQVYQECPAAAVEEALAWLEELAELHQQTWTARGKPGAFASERF
jgi:hypothetical protein